MPNWCQNQATISGPKPVIDEIKQVLNSDRAELLNWMRPMPPAESENWYDWCCTSCSRKEEISTWTTAGEEVGGVVVGVAVQDGGCWSGRSVM